MVGAAKGDLISEGFEEINDLVAAVGKEDGADEVNEGGSPGEAAKGNVVDAGGEADEFGAEPGKEAAYG